MIPQSNWHGYLLLIQISLKKLSDNVEYSILMIWWCIKYYNIYCIQETNFLKQGKVLDIVMTNLQIIQFLDYDFGCRLENPFETKDSLNVKFLRNCLFIKAYLLIWIDFKSILKCDPTICFIPLLKNFKYKPRPNFITFYEIEEILFSMIWLFYTRVKSLSG